MTANAEYEEMMELSTENGIGPSAAHMRELLSYRILNLVAKYCYPEKKRHGLTEEVKTGLRKLARRALEGVEMRKFETDVRELQRMSARNDVKERLFGPKSDFFLSGSSAITTWTR